MKRGDRVVCTNAALSSGCLTQGKTYVIYEVIEKFNVDRGTYLILEDNPLGAGWRIDRFKKWQKSY